MTFQKYDKKEERKKGEQNQNSAGLNDSAGPLSLS